MSNFVNLYRAFQRFHKFFDSNFYSLDFINDRYIGTNHNVIKTYTCKACTKITFNPETHECYLAAHCVEAYLCKKCNTTLDYDAFLNHVCPNDLNLCPTCKSAFTHPLELMEHINDVHKNLQFKCTDCPNSYRSKKALKYHYEIKHSTPTFTCNVCAKVFTSRYSMIRHKKIIHAKDYVCPKCGASFRFSKGLSRHTFYFHKEVTELNFFRHEIR